MSHFNSINTRVMIDGQEVPVSSISVTHDQAASLIEYDVSTLAATSGGSFTTSGTFSVGGCVPDGGILGTSRAACSHVVSESLIEYQDDLVIAYCMLCEARVTLQRVPGGLNKLKVTNVLALLREDPTGDYLQHVVDLERDCEIEIEELQNALSLLLAAKEEACRRLLQ